jgi:hypothetical protein
MRLQKKAEARMRIVALALAATFLTAAGADADDLVPTGTLRATFIAGNPVQAVTDTKTGEVSGPAADFLVEETRASGSIAAARRALTASPQRSFRSA